MDDHDWLSVPAQPVQSYRTRGARVRHVLAIALGWIVFGWLWVRAAQEPGAVDDLRQAALVLGVLVVVVLAVTYLWIEHNVALARRRGGRRSGGPVPSRPTCDQLGRRLEVDDDATRANLVVLDVVDGVKRFRSAVASDA